MKLILGDCLDKLKELDDNSVDSIVTDPPYGLAFMGKQWDYDVPSVEIWKECLRVLKPGGHLLSFAGSRTYHRMTVRIEDAGFEIRDQIMWIYGSGFPKSHDVGKNIEKRKVGGIKNLKQIGTKQGIKVETGTQGYSYNKEYVPGVSMGGKQISGEIPVYQITNEYKGWGTALKPAHEPIVMARKPLSENSVADNVNVWGTGGINIDECRIATTDQSSGRFPANVIFDAEAGKLLDEQSGITKSGVVKTDKGAYDGVSNTNFIRGVSNKNNQHGDSGGASRFFYCPKTSQMDRNEGLDGFAVKKSSSMSGRRKAEDMSDSKIDNDVTGRFVTERQNIHPTVKPTDLMGYLIRLVTPKGGTVLDPFMGSGSTGKAAVRGGFGFVGIEREDEYMKIAEARIQYELNRPKSTGKSTKYRQAPVIQSNNKFW